MSFVIGASIAAKWFLRDERSSFAGAMLDKVATNGALAPALFRWEIGNILLVAERADRISGEDVDNALDALRALPIALDPPGASVHGGAEIALARCYDLAAYDAAYLALAARHNIPLATDDAVLAHAARDLGIEVLQPGKN